MGLEGILDKCLAFLRNTTNPLVPIDVLYETCVSVSERTFSKEALLAFLRNHDDILIVDSAEDGLTVPEEAFTKAGVTMGPRAILKSRMPSREEMVDMFQQQLDAMRLHLRDALEKAQKNNDEAAIVEIEAALKRTDSIEEKMKEF